MSILNHPFWSKLQPYVYKKLSHYALKTKEPIYRLELSNDIPQALLDGIREIEIECANTLCRQLHTPVRPRSVKDKKTGIRRWTNRFYLATSCRNLSCTRTDDVTAAKQAIEAAVSERMDDDA